MKGVMSFLSTMNCCNVFSLYSELDALPNDVSMDEIIHALYVNIKFSHGEQEIREGKVITQADAKKQLEK